MSISEEWISEEAAQPASLSDKPARKPKERQSGLGLGAALIALPFSLIVSIALVATGVVSLAWALPVYALLGAGLTLLFAAAS